MNRSPSPTIAPKPFHPWAAALCLGLLLFPPTEASAQQLQAPARRDGEQSLHLLSRTIPGETVPRHVLVFGDPAIDGKVLTLPLAPTARLGDLRRHGEYWWVASVEPMGDSRQGLTVLSGVGDEVERLSAPAPAAPLAMDPVLLTDRRGLRALVWLEGPAVRRLAVRAVRWNGEGWDPPQTVSPPGPGTQIALSATRLGDGSWMAVWSSFDGQDDEILWSRAVDGRWLAPRPLVANNDVPDITPTLTTTGEGAMVAWSRYDGGAYRTLTATFLVAEGDGWSLPLKVGERGEVFPRFLPAIDDSSAPLLALQRTAPKGWSLSELSDDGTPRQTTRIDISHDHLPRLVSRDADGLILAWDRCATKGTEGEDLHHLSWATDD